MNRFAAVLGAIGPPWCVALLCSVQEVTGHVNEWAEEGLVVRILRGRKMRGYSELFDEFAAALQFPWYFGENGNAFNECMTDLAWLPSQRGYAFIITEPGQVLQDTDDDGLSWLVRSLARCAAEWADPIQDGQPWDRLPVPFHVVLQVDDRENESAVKLWAAAGADVTLLDL